MPRRSIRKPKTALGAALRKRRGRNTLVTAAAESGVDFSTLARIERGDTAAPTGRTSLALAAWLGEGWTVERVIRAGLEQLGDLQPPHGAGTSPESPAASG